MSPYRRTRRLDRDEIVARRAAGTPIEDGSGRVVRNGVIVSAQDNANAAATRARDAAFARQTGQYADRSGTVDPDAEGQAAYDATMSGEGMAPASPVRRAPRGAGVGMDAGGADSPTTIAASSLKRAYRDLQSIRTDNREQKINLAKAAGTFGAIRDDWNARNAGRGRAMDEAGNIADMTQPAREEDGGAEPAAPAQPASPVLRVGPAFQGDEERVQGIANAKVDAKIAAKIAAAQREVEMARALGITVEELRRRRSARRLGPSMSTPSA